MFGVRQILARLARALRPHGHHPQVARRVRVRCPHSGETVEIETGSLWSDEPRRLLRCSDRPECPPACDQACRREHELFHGRADVLIVRSPGAHPEDDVD